MKKTNIAIALMVTGIVLRFIVGLKTYPYWDGAFYMHIGREFSHGSLSSGYQLMYEYSSFASIYSLSMGIWFWFFNYSFADMRIYLIFISIITCIVFYSTTRSLYGPDKAMLASAIFFLLEPLIIGGAQGRIDNFLVLFVILFAYYVKKIDASPNNAIWVGVFTGMVYLSRSNVGVLIYLVAITGLFLYLYHQHQHKRNIIIGYVVALAFILFRANTMMTEQRVMQDYQDKSLMGDIIMFSYQLFIHIILISPFIVLIRPTKKMLKDNLILIGFATSLFLFIVFHATSEELFSVQAIGRVSRYYIMAFVPILLWLSLESKLDWSKNIRRIATVPLAIAILYMVLYVDDFILLPGAFALVAFQFKDRKRFIALAIGFLLLSVNSATSYYEPSVIKAVNVIENSQSGSIVVTVLNNGVEELKIMRIDVYTDNRVNFTYEPGGDFIISQIQLENLTLLGKFQDTIRPSILSKLKSKVLSTEPYQGNPPIYVYWGEKT